MSLSKEEIYTIISIMNAYVNTSSSPQENWLAVATAYFVNGDHERALEAVAIAATLNNDISDPQYAALKKDCRALAHMSFMSSVEQLLATGQRAEASRLLAKRIRLVEGEEKAELQRKLASLAPKVKKR